MTCKCKLPIIRGYEPDIYCLNCGLKLKNKTMNKKIKDVIKLKKGYKYLSLRGNFETTSNDFNLIKQNDLWVVSFGLPKFSETTIRENPELFEDVYEEEQKELIVSIKYEDDKDFRIKPSDVFNCLTSNEHHNDDFWQIKVTEIKPGISKEDVKWLYDKFACSFRTLDTVWAELQAKKEAENNG